MTFTVDFFERDFGEKINYPQNRIEVVKYSKGAVGGCMKASMQATGQSVELWQFVNMLRCPVVIYDNRGKKVWWGYVSRVTLTVDGIRRHVSIDDVVNNVYVAYTYNGERKTTAVASDSDSESEFGKIEKKFSLDDVTDTEAEQYRDVLLNQRKYPAVSVPYQVRAGGNTARIECRGWWSTLDWQYYNTDVGLEEYVDIDDFPGREVGRDQRPMVAQSFQQTSGESWTADTIWLRCRKVVGTSITDDLEAHIYDDSGGVPNTSQDSGSVTGSTLNEYFEWKEFSLSSGVSLSDSTTYWIVVKRSDHPSVDINDYYRVDGNRGAGYSNGKFMLYNSDASTWRDYSLPMDMNFRVTWSKSTTTQITDIITECGEFILDTDIIDTSGLSSVPSKDGDNTARWEIERILRKGTTNDLRLLARVLSNYHVEIYEEDALNEADWFYRKGEIKDENGAIVPPQECPVGMWMRFADIIPDYVNKNRLNNAGYAFVEEAEYRVRDRTYNVLETRDITKFKELFETQNG